VYRHCPIPGLDTSDDGKIYKDNSADACASCQFEISVSSCQDAEIIASGGALYDDVNQFGYSLQTGLLMSYLSRLVYFGNDLWSSSQPKKELFHDPKALSPFCRYWLGTLDTKYKYPNMPCIKALSSKYDSTDDPDYTLRNGLFTCESLGVSGMIFTRFVGEAREDGAAPAVDEGSGPKGQLFVVFRGTACSSSTLSDWDMFVQTP
jgi:hypothetical protein